MGSCPGSANPTVPRPKERLKTTIGYVKRDFLLGGTFSSLDDMNRQLLQWLNRVNATPHGTTNEIPFERLRQENLKSIVTIPPYRLRREERRKISREAYISYRGNRYSVPYRYAGREAVLELHDDQMTVRGRYRSHLFAYRRSRSRPGHPGEGALLWPSQRSHAMQLPMPEGFTPALYDGSSAGGAPATLGL
jgi:hypothetical protein